MSSGNYHSQTAAGRPYTRTDLSNNSIVESGTIESGNFFDRTWDGANGPRPPAPPFSKRVFYTVLNKKGRVVKRSYKSRPPLKRAKYRAPNNYTMSLREYRFPAGIVFQTQETVNGVYNWRYDNVSAYYFLGSAYIGPIAPVFDANDQIRLVGKLRDTLRGSSFNMGVFLGEGHQTLKMITSSATLLAGVMVQAKRGNFSRAYRLLREHPASHKRLEQKRETGANGWLALQYGVVPLLSDMKEGAEQLSHLLHVPFRQRYRERIKKLCSDSDIAAWRASSPYLSKVSLRSCVTRQVIATISEPESIPVVSGILDPELILWELTPWSFVADWVIPIGQYLEARAFANRLHGEFVTTDRSLRSTIGSIESSFENPPGSGYRQVLSGLDILHTQLSMTRTVSSALNVPLPTVKPLEKIASWQHCANAIALLVGVSNKLSNKLFS